MPPTAIEGFQLSSQQRRLWALLEEHDVDVATYHARCSVLIEGKLDFDNLRTALQSIAARHEILRTSFGRLPGMLIPLQIIDAPCAMSLEHHDLSDLNLQEQDVRVEALFQEWGRRPFDFEQSQLWQLSLARLSVEKHVLFIRLPALCADAVTLKNLLAEISRCYTEAGADTATQLDEPMQYADFAQWQNELLEADETEAGRAYWLKQDLSVLGNLALPYKPAISRDHEFSPHVFHAPISRYLAEQLETLAAERHESLSLLLLGCWQVLVSRLDGGPETIIGALHDGRNYEELQKSLGAFARYLPLKNRFDLAQRFDQFLTQTSKTVQDAEAYQNYFSWEQEGASSIRGGRTPSLEFGFDYDDRRISLVANLSFSLLQQYVCLDRFTVRLVCVHARNGLFVELHYDANQVRLPDIECLTEQYLTLLHSVVTKPDTPVGELEILSDAQRQWLLVGLNDTKAEFPNTITIHQLFEEQVKLTPDAIAVCSEGQQLTYDELNTRADRLARRLIALSVKPDVLVGIYLEQSLEMIEAMLGILKAGGAYVPLDLTLPKERLAFVIDDTQMSVVVTRGSLAETFADTRITPLCLDVNPDGVDDSSGKLESNGGASAANLAYVIYTSGSTGSPKGVAVEHRQLLNYTRSIERRLELKAAEQYATLSTFAADLGNTVIFPSLCTGGCLHVLSREVASDPEALADYFRLHPVDYLKIVPSHLKALLVSVSSEQLLPRRCLILGGEASRREWVEELRRSAPHCRILNHYGPTEATVGALTFDLEKDASHGFCSSTLPLGVPLANAQVYILDWKQRLAPIGITGELYIGGAGVARGYLHRADLTAERFIPNPFSVGSGERIYRTGDLARCLPDGTIEFLGRNDHQVKLRGFRVELGEIEAVLAEHPFVAEAAVLCCESAPGETHLVGYVAAKPQPAQVNGGRELYRLRNGMTVVHHSRAEADYLYEEIFEERVYMRHEISLPPGACVFDVGANIGIFMLFVAQQCPDARIYAFEPVAPIFESLQINAGLYGLDSKLFNCGLGEREEIAEFTYYPNFSARSGLSAYASLQDEIAVTKQFMLSRRRNEPGETNDFARAADELLRNMLVSEVLECRLKTISDVIREESIERIDLLKVDVQRAELDVLSGIKEGDWARIAQIVMEVHDTEGRVSELVRFLEERGYQVAVEQDHWLKGTDRYNLYATRFRKEETHTRAEGKAFERAQPALLGTAKLDAAFSSSDNKLSAPELRAYLGGKLPEYMLPSAFVILENLPRMPNGKIDRTALIAIEPKPAQSSESFDAPRTPTEQALAAIFGDVLGVGQVGLEDNFFELGGHSLLATQVMSRVRTILGVELSLRSLFERSTVKGLGQRVESARRAAQGVDLPSIPACSRAQRLPLSFAQQRLWFLDQLEPGSSTYNIPIALRLKGQLNYAILQQTINEVVRRHETLRTGFAVVDSEPVQVIAPALSIELEVVELSHLAEAEREVAVSRQVREQAEQPFDLSRVPLLRVQLLRLEAAEHVLMWVMHHIISDGWSMGVLVREVAALYEAYIEERESGLRELPIQYGDYAVWQRERLQGEVLGREVEYWKDQLRGAPPVLELATDYARAVVQSKGGARYQFKLGVKVTAGLKELSGREGVTLFMTLLSGFAVLLARYSRQEEVVIGTPIAGRTREETEGLIGFFVNTLALRIKVDGDERFAELMRRVKEVCLGAYAHQEIPFERLVEELRPERSLSHTPLFQVMMALQNAPREQLELPGLKVEIAEASTPTVKFDLMLTLTERANRVEALLEYNTALFHEETIKRLAGHYEVLLEAIAAAPQQRLAELPLLSSEEREQILYEWNETGAVYPFEKCLHELFEEQVERTPEAIALVCEDERLSYGELNRRANQIAHHLRRLGVREEMLVGVLLERSVAMVVSLLGILKAGGAYVPLEPEYPQERLTFMVADAGIAVLLTQEELSGKVRVSSEVRRVEVDRQWEKIAAESGVNIETEVVAENLAYVIYTSGSTGKPKGVMVSHRSLCNHMFWIQQISRFDPSDVVLLKTPISFDASVWEFSAPLLVGACLVLARPGGQRDSAYLVQAILDYGVTTLQVVPSALQVLINEEKFAACRSLRRVFCGGEELRLGLRESFHSRLQCDLHNLYGPTEATIDATWMKCVPGAAVPEGSIGRPLANTEVYVLDTEWEPVPVGVPGEIFLGGEALARGYVGRAEWTAERFVPHPFSKEPGARLYRTGDIGRYSADGQIVFMGRNDQQVKLRGYRVEFGEIEEALVEHPLVKESAVAMKENSGNKRLVAYIVAAGLEPPPVTQLRQHLRERLPEYMIPAQFVMLDRLPLTPTGKLDRRALPDEQLQATVSKDFIAPRTAAEQALASIFSEVLGVGQVGLDDNFFELGGHSLLATKVVASLRATLGVELPLRSLFEHPTVRGLLETIAQAYGGMEVVEEIALTFNEIDQLSTDQLKAMLAE